MKKITYVIGDVTTPWDHVPNETIMVLHVSNNTIAPYAPTWGKGVAAAIKKAFPTAYESFKQQFSKAFVAEQPYVRVDANTRRLESMLGRVIFSEETVGEKTIVVASVIAQDGLPSFNNQHPFKLESFATGFMTAYLYASTHTMPIIMPRVGIGFGRSSWEPIHEFIHNVLNDKSLSSTPRVFVVDQPFGSVPQIGMGVTEHVGSDRYVYEVIGVISPTRLIIQRCIATPTPEWDYHNQHYTYERNEHGEQCTIALSNGIWYRVGTHPKERTTFDINVRTEYRDPSF